MRRKPKRQPRKDGRPTELTAELQEHLCGEIRRARTVAEACRTAGISEATFFRWQAKGTEEPAGPHRDFREAVARAKVERIEALEDHVVRAARTNWRPALELLKVYAPGRFTPQIRVHVERELSAAVDRVEAAFATEPELYDRVLRAIAGTLAPDAAGVAGVAPGAAIGDGGAVPAVLEVDARAGD